MCSCCCLPQLPPKVITLLVYGQVQAAISAEVSHIETLRVNAILLRDKLPGHATGVSLEVVPKGPVAQHLKERVVIAVCAHNLQVVMLASHTNAFLGVDRSTKGRSSLAQEDAFELQSTGEIRGRVCNWIGHAHLVHPCVDKGHRGITERHHRAGPHKLVIFIFYEVPTEPVPNLLRRARLGVLGQHLGHMAH